MTPEYKKTLSSFHIKLETVDLDNLNFDLDFIKAKKKKNC